MYMCIWLKFELGISLIYMCIYIPSSSLNQSNIMFLLFVRMFYLIGYNKNTLYISAWYTCFIPNGFLNSYIKMLHQLVKHPHQIFTQHTPVIITLHSSKHRIYDKNYSIRNIFSEVTSLSNSSPI